MIVERLSFQARYGHGDELVALFKEFLAAQGKELGLTGGRIYTDLTGTMFTMQVESEFEDLAAYAKFMATDTQMFQTQAFQDWFGKMMTVTDGGERQLFNVETVSV